MSKEIDKLAWLCIRERRLLGARSENKTLYYIPGGKREAGENDEQALCREVKEELSVTLLPDTLRYAGTFRAHAEGKAEGVQVKMTCYFADFIGELRAAAEIAEIRWLSAQDGEQCSPAARLIFEHLHQQRLID
ncbi:NUDIX domain-containing protein [Affinibrenneria salicis]|uniref:NUDIX domain-containing protein n=1 Tax=Affinibrenneria salicis TaxID=2590031 RepID=A0A5J5FRS1_9GAMM|nr:NUDIX domain-containing protein [Affinibrenneria salicis]KAA8995499.1 NUDIX domain-containing protein [Affinibrenneria salicis]